MYRHDESCSSGGVESLSCRFFLCAGCRRQVLVYQRCDRASERGRQISAESARGVSPRAAHRTGLEPLDSSGSCHPLKTAVFRRHQHAPPVSRWHIDPDASDPPPSLHPHYRDFITTTEQSAPVRRIGTFSLTVSAACAFPLASTDRFSSSVH
jgi:hypothetical protein